MESKWFKDNGSLYRIDEEDGKRSVFILKDGKEVPLPKSNGFDIEMDGKEIPDPRDRTAY